MLADKTEVEEVYSALEESARLVGAVCVRDKAWPVLDAFGAVVGEDLVVLGVQSGKRNAAELDFSFRVPGEIGNPYPYALEKGFVGETDHPVGTLLSDVGARFPVQEYYVDAGVVGGFKKLYAHFPLALQPLAALTDIPSMPEAVAENAGLFARYGLDKVAMVGVNYRANTMNLYFQFAPDNRPEPGALASMLREMGMPEPTEAVLRYVSAAMRANITLGWDSAHIFRVALAPPPSAGFEPAEIPAPMEPHMERFVREAPFAYEGERVNLIAVKWVPEEQFVEANSYYQLSPMLKKLTRGD
ncbi:aromatic prenyltransferase [Streptomyces sp. CNQ-509]|uniref:aromatic prenyltransferase n=1 Tax=Streptomyces sp. CNQ-509 TaxID=444103 RepID=UPI00069C63CF|nr:aromatic prenyltransferase [Streptomyces sp. CNQ-509]